MIIPPTGSTFGREIYVSEALIEPPTSEPIELDEVKKHIRFTPTSEDTLIETYISMARQYFEEYTGLQLMPAVWEQRLNQYPSGVNVGDDVIELRRSPVIEIVSITHDDGSPEQEVDAADYALDIQHAPQRSTVRPVSAWPSSDGSLGSVRIRYRAGYSTEGSPTNDVPALIKGVLYLLVGYFHQFRSEAFVNSPGGSLEKLPLGAEQIMRSFKSVSTRPPIRLSV